LTAGTGAEKSFQVTEGNKQGYSVFTRAFLDSIRETQSEGGFLTLTEILAGVERRVAEFSRGNAGRQMTPRRWQIPRQPGKDKGTFIFLNPSAKKPSVPTPLKIFVSVVSKQSDSDTATAEGQLLILQRKQQVIQQLSSLQDIHFTVSPDMTELSIEPDWMKYVSLREVIPILTKWDGSLDLRLDSTYYGLNECNLLSELPHVRSLSLIYFKGLNNFECVRKMSRLERLMISIGEQTTDLSTLYTLSNLKEVIIITFVRSDHVKSLIDSLRQARPDVKITEDDHTILATPH
jgi:hypothetical protein